MLTDRILYYTGRIHDIYEASYPALFVVVVAGTEVRDR